MYGTRHSNRHGGLRQPPARAPPGLPDRRGARGASPRSSTATRCASSSPNTASSSTKARSIRCFAGWKHRACSSASGAKKPSATSASTASRAWARRCSTLLLAEWRSIDDSLTEFSRSHTMDLLDRYLQAVRFFLPPSSRTTSSASCRRTCISQMEDRAEELGRPLSEDEQADILRRHGHPMLVAGRYRSRQQLIGPTFFPHLRVRPEDGLAIALLVTIVLATVTSLAARRSDSTVGRGVPRVPGPRADGVRMDDAWLCGAGPRAKPVEARPPMGSHGACPRSSSQRT